MNTSDALHVTPIRAFQDNYIWLMTRAGGSSACVVDPGDAAPVQEVLRERNLALDAILLTHHHADHTGGVLDLVRDHRPQVFGPANNRIQGISKAVQEGDRVEVLGQRFRVLEVPGHTLDHIAYVSEEAQPPLLFCGDTLFAGGCGRLFEGSAAQMYKSLQKLASLPESTLMYCAHEYTLNNLRFAVAAEPDNESLRQRLENDSLRLNEERITIPATILTELRTNPFLRCHIQSLREKVDSLGEKTHNEVEVFAALRRWKDEFR